MLLVRARFAVVASSIFVMAACARSSEREDLRVQSKDSGVVATAFSASAAKSGVPRDLLVAIAKVEDGLEIPAVRSNIDEDNDVPAAGPLQLRRGKLDTLARAAALSGRTEIDLRTHADAALEAGALVLAELGQKSDARADDLPTWKAAIEEMSGFADAPHRERYAHQVFALLARGGRFEARDGEFVTIAQHDIPPALTFDLEPVIKTLATSEYAGAEWIPTSCNDKCVPGRPAPVQFIVVHDTEGGWNASVATLQNDPGKSVQYIVGTDGKVAQFVVENTTAWHSGNRHYNERSVGIEHVGYSTKPFSEAEYAASAKLVDYLAKKYKVPTDRAHIIGHDQIPNGNKIASSSAPCATSPKACQSNLSYGGASHHTDPGIWEWPTFMDRFGGASKCNDVTNLWNCSEDKKKAFRCVGDKVEVATCNGPGACAVMPNGQDDKCDIVPTSTNPPPVTPPAPEEPKPPVTNASPLPTPEEPAPQDDSGGCNVARGTSAPSGSLALLALGVVAVLGARRRRSRSAYS
jgi:MYXO-CTERM domain-containing protein